MNAEATLPPARSSPRPRRPLSALILKWFGVACLMVASVLGGYIGWLLWGTGLTTQREQARLRPGIEHVLNTKDAKKSPNVVKLPGDAVAVLVIPRIDLNMVVVEGTDTESLKKGPGHYSDSAYPWQDHGRVAIAGHRTTYLHPFYSLDKLRQGDPIILKTEYGTFRYVVSRSFIIDPSDGSVLDQTDAPTLVLTTCNPRYSAAQRLIVTAHRV